MWRVVCVGRLRCPNILVREGLTVQAAVWYTPTKYWPHVAYYILYFKDRPPGGLLRQSIRIPLVANQSSWPILFHFSHNWFYFYLTWWIPYFAQLLLKNNCFRATVSIIFLIFWFYNLFEISKVGSIVQAAEKLCVLFELQFLFN